ncbi:FecR family protein [Compostibacter hankyongensis]|uniref:FecR family protein n=1 Tax=Compostibacter hankyongensis TaxID=1007089 RepID=A0ABP8G0Y9_9BACT
MAADSERLNHLFERYLRRECTPEEVEELVSLLQQADTGEKLSGRLSALWETLSAEKKSYPVDWREMYKNVTGHPSTSSVRILRRRRLYLTAAATAALLLGSAAVYFHDHTPLRSPQASAGVRQEITPGGNKARLTLSDGTTVPLGEAEKTIPVRQGNVRVRQDSGALTYHALQGNTSPASPEYNTLSTPRGGQYQLQLSDGTRVWLNAASSVRYPTVFTGKTREVGITGEAYFDVAPDPDRPFVVRANHTEVKVLSTEFNIDAYPDEHRVRTTLVKGKVKVRPEGNNGRALLLQPGQQAESPEDGPTLLAAADVDEATAWKRGLFVFHNDDLASIMRKLGRWYDIEVSYKENRLPSSHFTGAIRRQENIGRVLEMLALTGGAHFEVRGRQVIVTP